MSEKRFTYFKVPLGFGKQAIKDNANDEVFDFTLSNVLDKLNEQQDIISKQLDRIIELQDKYRILEFNHSRLEKRNKAQYEKIGEQQATIKKLQDLCGQSDSENAKLRIENKKLKAKLKEKEEDEQLYANEIVKLNKEAKEVLDFKSLGGNY